MALDLASLLVAEHLVTPADLARAHEARVVSGRPLWAELVESELVTEEQIFALLDGCEGFPLVGIERLAALAPPARLLEVLPAGKAIVAGLIPLELSPDGRQALVAMIDPSDSETLAELAAAAELDSVRALLAAPSALKGALRRIYGEAASIELDPRLADELSRMPAEALQITPLPTPRPVEVNLDEIDLTPRPVMESEELAAAERLSRALVSVVEALAVELELRLGARPRAAELSRLARRVARQLGCAPGAVDEIGVVALVHAVHHALQLADGRHSPEAAVELVESLGWAAAADGGIAHALRVLTAAASPFGRASAAGAPPLGARIVSACADYLELTGAADGHDRGAPDRDTVSQLLRAGSATAPVVDALLRVLSQPDQPDPSSRAAGAPKE
jgi:hypothetical protein